MPEGKRLKGRWRLNSLVQRACLKLPPAGFLYATAALTVSVLLIVMLPVYFTTRNSDERQTESRTWPQGMDEAELVNLVKDQINVQVEVIDVSPEEHTAMVTFELHPGGKYDPWDDLGVYMLPDGDDSYFVLTVGEQKAIKMVHGDQSEERKEEFLLSPKRRLFFYPFDVYQVVLEMRATLLSPDDVAEALPLGIVYSGGRSGWKLSETFSPLDDLPPSLGARVTITLRRSDAVRFCAILIICFMWAISLVMFAISMNFIVSSESESSYDVPSLSVGLLFALPFVRTVMPDVPDVGLACDMLGFFWNIILVALSTLLTMASILRKYRRKIAAEALRALEALEAGEGSMSDVLGRGGEGGGGGSLKGRNVGAPASVHPAPMRD